jgi:hypothetical protein
LNLKIHFKQHDKEFATSCVFFFNRHIVKIDASFQNKSLCIHIAKYADTPKPFGDWILRVVHDIHEIYTKRKKVQFDKPVETFKLDELIFHDLGALMISISAGQNSVTCSACQCLYFFRAISLLKRACFVLYPF